MKQRKIRRGRRGSRRRSGLFEGFEGTKGSGGAGLGLNGGAGSPAPLGIQTKLEVNAPGDRFEREADGVADQVMRAPSASFSDLGAPTGRAPSGLVRRKEGARGGGVGGGGARGLAAHASLGGLGSFGRQLPPAARREMAPHFGAELSQVRVHTDERASELSRSLNARAFTVGRDIFFRKGEFQPGSPAGKRLLAHELVHVRQQRASSPRVQRQVEGERAGEDGFDIVSTFIEEVEEFPPCDEVPAIPHQQPPSADGFAANSKLAAIRAEEPGRNANLLGRLVTRGEGDARGATELVQQSLLAWGCSRFGRNVLPKYGADADFGGETERAVALFQKSEGIADDGIVGPITLARFDRLVAFAGQEGAATVRPAVFEGDGPDFELADAGMGMQFGQVQAQLIGAAGHRGEHEADDRTSQRAKVDANNREKAVEVAGSDSALMCFLLCYLGLPPGLWRIAVRGMLGSLSEEFRARHSEAKADAEFQKARLALKSLSPLRLAKAVLTFALEGKVGPVTLTASKAKAIQRRVLAQLMARVAPRATLTVGLQIARKALFAIEVAMVAGCATYCGALTAANQIIEFSKLVSEGLADVQRGAEAVGGLVGQVLVQPIFYARASVDPTNLKLTSRLAGRSAADLAVLLNFIWVKLKPEQTEEFVKAVGKPLGSYQIPQNLLQVVAKALAATASTASGLDIVVTTELLRGLDPVGFVQLLRLLGVAHHIEEPAVVARRQPSHSR